MKMMDKLFEGFLPISDLPFLHCLHSAVFFLLFLCVDIFSQARWYLFIIVFFIDIPYIVNSCLRSFCFSFSLFLSLSFRADFHGLLSYSFDYYYCYYYGCHYCLFVPLSQLAINTSCSTLTEFIPLNE